MRSLSILTCTLFYSLLVHVSLGSVVSTGDFNKDFYITWSADYVNTSSDAHMRTLKLDNSSGCGFGSNEKFIFGQMDMMIKLVPGHPAGTVVAYYLQSSDEATRDEIDFEFLGNIEGEPYVVQTNIFTNGVGNREEKIKLWFDPTLEFHTYSIHWNIHQLVFMVDKIPIRVFRNYADQGVAYPTVRPMRLLASIWNGESWATGGGKDKIDWTKAPFFASFKDYTIDACVSDGVNPGVCSAVSDANWWNQDRYKTLLVWEKIALDGIRENYLTYDYCQDSVKYKNEKPKECSLPK